MMCVPRLSRECMEGVKLDDLTSSDTQRLQTEYSSSLSLSQLSDDSLPQLMEDLCIDVSFHSVCRLIR